MNKHTNAPKSPLDLPTKKIHQFGIALTMQCPLRCRHCLIEDKRGDFPIDKLNELLQKVAQVKLFNLVAYTGGEPFFVFENLRKAVRYSKENGLAVSVVTSGYWARTRELTRKYLESLRGLDMINVSLDKYHQEYVPLTNIENILAVARELAIRASLMMISPDRGLVEKYVKEYSCRYTVNDLSMRPKLDRGMVEIAGKAEAGSLCTKGPFCIKQPPYIDIHGDIFYCCGLAPVIGKENNLLFAGNVFEAGMIETKFNLRKRKKVAKFLTQKMPAFLKAVARAGIKLSGQYLGNCDVCYDIFRHHADNPYLVKQFKA